MKTMTFIMTLLTGSVALATDWPLLISQGPNLKKETLVLDDNELIKVDVVKLPSGKYRLVEVVSFAAAKRPILIISDTAGKNVNEICRNSMNFAQPFKAQLVVQTDPMATNPRPIFGKDFNSFENPVKIGPAKISFDRKNLRWTVFDAEMTKTQTPTDYYEEIMNTQLAKSADGVLRLDLSNRNGLACDLALGNLNFITTRILEYEPGLPKKENWLSIENYVSIFRLFWKLQPQVIEAKIPASQNDMAEAIALGVVTQRLDLGDELLKSPTRIKKFLASMKLDTRGLSTTQKTAVRSTEIGENWDLNIDYVKPSTETVQKVLTVGRDDIFVKYEN